eukprot:147074_1
MTVYNKLQMIYPQDPEIYINNYSKVFITKELFSNNVLNGKKWFDKYTLIRHCSKNWWTKPTMNYNESNDNICWEMYDKIKQIKFYYFDHHNSLNGPFNLDEFVTFYRIEIIHNQTLTQTNINHHNNTYIHSDATLSKVLPYHSKRYKYLNLCFEFNNHIKKLQYKQINNILNNIIFTNDLYSMKYIFRSLSSCFSFCILCKQQSKNPIQTLLTLRIKHQSKCDKIIEILKLFTNSFKNIHSKRILKEKHITECRCWNCCKKRCSFDAYIPEERYDFANQLYEIIYVQNEIENNYDYLLLSIIPHHSTNAKYDIQIIKYLLENKLVNLLPHHFIFAVQYHRTNILKYLFEYMNQYNMNIIKQHLWFPKQFTSFSGSPSILQHPSRVSILGYALQTHLLDIQIIKILLNNGLSPNFDDLMIITSVFGNKRIGKKREIIEYLLNYKNCDKFLFDFGVYWFEICLTTNLLFTAAMISSKLIPIIMNCLLNEKMIDLIPKDIIKLIMIYTYYPIDPNNGWLDIDGNEIIEKANNMEFALIFGIFGVGGPGFNYKAKTMVPPKCFWEDTNEYKNINGTCIDENWSVKHCHKLIKLPISFSIGGKHSMQVESNDNDKHLIGKSNCYIL